MATEVAAGWADLLEGEEIAYRGLEPARKARTEPLPDDLDPRVASSLVANGRHVALPPPGRGVGGGEARRERRRHDRHRIGEVARLQPPRARRDRTRAEDARALPLPDEGARAGPGARARRAPAQGPAAGDLRRRHAAERRWQIRKWSNAILTNPDMLHVGVLPHHDRWGDVLHNLRYVDRRRGARLPRRLRLARRATCCGGFGAWLASTARIRSSCSRPRRSPTPASSRRRSRESPRPSSSATRHRSPSARS